MIAAYPFRACRNPFLPPPHKPKVAYDGEFGKYEKNVKNEYSPSHVA